MKYMGSKQWMLRNGLGHILTREVGGARRFVDMFAGSGSVSHFVSQRVSMPVLACDLQAFSGVLTRSIIGRALPLCAESIWRKWHRRAERYLRNNASIPRRSLYVTQARVRSIRRRCAMLNPSVWPIAHVYGGHYFSRAQALWLDAYRQTLPMDSNERDVALSALITAAAKAVAAPGHTAQPFQPTRTAKRYLATAWRRDISSDTKAALEAVAPIHAMVPGKFITGNANDVSREIGPDDVVFVDPPYSSVHYSRFYHVLETLAKGACGAVSGIGRYPPIVERPYSRYSVKTQAKVAISELISTLAQGGASVILTFPNKTCSNGISGRYIRSLAKKHYANISIHCVVNTFSTLGGTGDNREARQHSSEMIIVMKKPYGHGAIPARPRTGAVLLRKDS